MYDYVSIQRITGLSLIGAVLMIILISLALIFRLVRRTESERVESLSLYS